KLPFTWYADLNQCGAHAMNAYPGVWREGNKIIDEEYKEGVYVGYRWIDKQKLKPLFPFGYGLSYTTFTLSKGPADKKQLTADEKISFTVSVTNTGNRAGAETVQLYVSDKKASVDRPVKELKSFQKVFLQPGETRDVTLTIGRDALSFFDEATGQWKAEPGDFEALIGTSSGNIPIKYSFELK
ncbi:MAG: fibronectin type III-like domain-contianing protein, partial [Muribaculaceae bacterium]|nr:fibronectin type III-like domain-contianing protein [Muribaculaceae bacterium]